MWPFDSKKKKQADVVPASDASRKEAIEEAMRRAKRKSQERKASTAIWQPPMLMPGVVPEGHKSAIAMDSACGPSYQYLNAGMYATNIQPFPGYQNLAALATRPEYRAFASTLSTEITREWIEITSKDRTKAKELADKIKELEEACEYFNLRHVFRQGAEHETLFGRAQISINIKGADDSTPLILDPRTIKQGSLRDFTAIEPMWTSPSVYNAIDPTAPDFYKPSSWWVLGRDVHASRLLTIITRPLPDMLKPAYNFSGMSLSQLAQPYVENWLRTRQAVADLVDKFSRTFLQTNMAQVLNGSDGGDVFDRVEMYVNMQSNLGMGVLDKETEDILQVNTPLSGLSELQAQSQEHLCVAAGTMVETERGQVAIENIMAGDKVLTRNGYAPVEWSGVTGMSSRLIEISADGSILLVTEEHPIWTEEKQDFVPAKNVSPLTRLRKSRGWGSMASLSHGEEGYGALQRPGITETQRPEGCCIECCGKPTLGQSHQEGMSITEMEMVTITRSKISRCSPEQSTTESMGQKASCCTCKQRINTASSVGDHMKRCGLTELNTVAQPAKPEHGSEEIRTEGVRVMSLKNEIEVYNLKVADGYLPEFYANGILVHNCSVSRIPTMILTGISPSGLNASSEGEIRAFYDWIAATQEAFYQQPIDTCLKVIQLHLWGEIDESITFKFKSLWQTSALEESTIRLNRANETQIYITHGVIDGQEARQQLADDPDSGWDNIDGELEIVGPDLFGDEPGPEFDPMIPTSEEEGD